MLVFLFLLLLDFFLLSFLFSYVFVSIDPNRVLYGSIIAILFIINCIMSQILLMFCFLTALKAVGGHIVIFVNIFQVFIVK
jgi:hypothetical protein